MNSTYTSMTAIGALETYFIDNRARLLEIASFLDRIDRYKDAPAAKADFRYKAFIKAIKLVIESEKDRTLRVQRLFSDPSTAPIESAVGLIAYGASENTFHESD